MLCFGRVHTILRSVQFRLRLRFLEVKVLVEETLGLFALLLLPMC